MASLYTKKIISLSVALVVGLLLAQTTYAASLFFSTPTRTIRTGDTFSVDLMVGTTEAINAASAKMSFDANVLEITSISKSGSIFSFWVEEPAYSNNSGELTFGGVVPNPGFEGTSGKALSVTFKAKKEGQTQISFPSGSILANDGKGTDVLETSKSSLIVISPATAIPVSVTPAATNTSGSAPRIYSTTHPLEDQWYSNDDPVFSWNLPEGTLELRTLVSQSPNDMPTVKYTALIEEKSLQNIEDGVHYFHLQTRTAAGWGPVGHFKFKVDTTAPDAFTINYPHGSVGFEPQPVLYFNTSDGESGVIRYDVKIADSDVSKIAPSALSNPYPVPPQEPGTYRVEVAAVDEAGNVQISSSEFTIESISAPVITYYLPEIDFGDIMKVRGVTHPNSDIILFVKKGDEVILEEYSKSNSSGDFSVVVAKRLNPGEYTFTTKVTDTRGAKSYESDPQEIKVKSRFIGMVFDSAYELELVALAIMLLLAAGVFGVYHKKNRISKRDEAVLPKKTKSGNSKVDAEFAKLTAKLELHIEKLYAVKGNRKLTHEERIFLEDFESELAKTQKNIQKEIKSKSSE